jgi:hypothetical protein
MNKEIQKKLTAIKEVAKSYSVSRIKLINGDIINDVIAKINDTTVVVKLSRNDDKNSKTASIKSPERSILYISDTNLLS